VSVRDVQPVPDAGELTGWFHEFDRLVDEAKERFEAGEFRPALASLAAVLPVHRLLVDGCGDLLVSNTAMADDPSSTQVGLYL
jgi:hypothetical protein